MDWSKIRPQNYEMVRTAQLSLLYLSLLPPLILNFSPLQCTVNIYTVHIMDWDRIQMKFFACHICLFTQLTIQQAFRFGLVIHIKPNVQNCNLQDVVRSFVCHV